MVLFNVHSTLKITMVHFRMGIRYNMCRCRTPRNNTRTSSAYSKQNNNNKQANSKQGTKKQSARHSSEQKSNDGKQVHFH